MGVMLLDSALERTIKKEEYFAMSERSLPYSELSHRHHTTLDCRTGPPLLNVSQEYGLASWVTELLTRNPPIISIDLEENLSPLPLMKSHALRISFIFHFGKGPVRIYSFCKT